MRGRKASTFCFRKTSFVHSQFGTYYALLLGYFGLKFLPDIGHCVYWVFPEIWDPNSTHRICNKFFIRHCQARKEGSFVSETGWFFSYVNTHPFDLKFVAFCPKFSQILTWNFRKKLFREYFSEILLKTKPILYRKMWNFAQLSAILFWVRIAFKKFTEVLSYVVCTQLRKHVHKQFTKRRCVEEKPGRFVFGKPVLFTLGPGLTTA